MYVALDTSVRQKIFTYCPVTRKSTTSGFEGVVYMSYEHFRRAKSKAKSKIQSEKMKLATLQTLENKAFIAVWRTTLHRGGAVSSGGATLRNHLVI